MKLNLTAILSLVINKVVEDELFDYMVSISNAENENQWFQIKYDNLNIAYPFHEEPIVMLQKLNLELPGGFEIESFELGSYLTISYDITDLENTEKFIVQYLAKVFNLSANTETWKQD